MTLINAGIGATGSNYGALRVERDVLSKKPDFVIVEFSCNIEAKDAESTGHGFSILGLGGVGIP